MTASAQRLHILHLSDLHDRGTREHETWRRQACQADVGAIENLALTQAAYYFRNTVEMAPPEARIALEALAWDHPVTLAPRTRRWLRRRLLLSDDDRLLIPVPGVWIREETEA